MSLAAGGMGRAGFRIGSFSSVKGSRSPRAGNGPPPPAVVLRPGSVLPFAHQGLAFRGPIAPLPGLQLQPAALMPDHPIMANAAFGLQSENLSQFAGRRLPPVIVFG